MNFEKREVVNTRNYKKITELDVFKISNNILYYKKDNKIGLIDINGKIIKEAIYDEIDDFQGNCAKVELDGKKGLIDKNGNVIINPLYYNLQYIKDYNISICNYKDLINNNGIDVINTFKKFYDIDFIYYLGGGLFKITSKAKTCIVNYEGKVIRKLSRSDSTYSIFKEKYLIKTNLFKRYIYNLNGDEIFSTTGILVDIINDDFLVAKDNIIKIIDKSGVLKNTIYLKSNYRYHSNGNMLLSKNNKNYIALKNNKDEFSFKINKYEEITSFKNDKIIIRNYNNRTYKLMNIEGNTLLNDCKHIKLLSDNLYVAEYKVFDKNIQSIIPDDCTNIIRLSNNIYQAETTNGYYIFNSLGKIIYQVNHRINLVDEKDELLVIEDYGKYILLDKQGVIIIPKVDNKILIINNNQILINNCLVNLNQEFLNIEIDYQIIMQLDKTYTYSFSSDERREIVLNTMINNCKYLMENMQDEKTYKKTK